MDSYPFLSESLMRKFNERKWQKELLNNSTVKNLFEQLVKQALIKRIPLLSITGHEEIIAIVARLNDVNTRFGKGETLLHWAASHQPAYGKHTSKVLVLLLLGADPNIQDVLGRTPLHWAVNHDCSDIASDKDSRKKDKCQSEAIKVIHQLLSFGASPNMVDKYGASPLCHAIWSKCSEIADILRPLTEERLTSTPCFILTNSASAKSVRCSKVKQWIKNNTSDVHANMKRLQSLMFCPGTGFLQHQEEVQMQKEQVLAFFRTISSNISKEDPLLEFVPRLAGSMAEGTKCQRPDEQDIILQLFKFENICFPEKSEYTPDGMITLKFTGSETETQQYKQYLLDGYLNREEILYSLITKLEKEVSSTSNWSSEDIMNIYPSHDLTAELKQTIEVGDVGTLSFIWHGEYYKQIKLSIDVVPAIIIKDWRPNSAITKDPIGKEVPNETVLILRAFTEDFEYDYGMHGELDSNTGSSMKHDMSTLEALNGDNWDSGSDCISENDIDEEEILEEVLDRFDYRNTYAVRSFRSDFGFSVSKSKRILRTMNAMIKENSENSETEVTEKRLKLAENDDKMNCKTKKEGISESVGCNPEFSTENTKYHAEPSTRAKTDCRNNADYVQTPDNDIFDENDAITVEIKLNRGTVLENYEKVNEYIPFELETESGVELKGVLPSGEDIQSGKMEIGRSSLQRQDDEAAGKSATFQELMEQMFGSENVESLNIKVVSDNSSDVGSSLDYEEDDSDMDESEDNTDTEEDSSEEPREDMAFRISYSKWENETMASFPYTIKSAYILSKILVSFVPEIRIPLNRGIHEYAKGYSGIKDIYSYMLKMALFSAVKKKQDLLKSDLNIALKNEGMEIFNLENTEYDFENITYSRLPISVEEQTDLMSSGVLKKIIFWANEVFSEIEASAEKGCLCAYFDPKLNILDRIANAGKQKNRPYPSMLYVRRHCEMIKSLLRVEKENMPSS